MQSLRSTLFIVSLLLFIVHQVMQKGLKINFPWFDHYFDNLLAMPVILSLLQPEKAFLFKKGNRYKLSVLEIVMATFYIILITEVVFPIFSKDFIGDPADIFFYLLGSLLFYLVNNSSKISWP